MSLRPPHQPPDYTAAAVVPAPDTAMPPLSLLAAIGLTACLAVGGIFSPEIFLLREGQLHAGQSIWQTLDLEDPDNLEGSKSDQTDKNPTSVPTAPRATTALTANPKTRPRFLNLKSGHTNVRAGPGKEYPLLRAICCAHYPVLVIDEFDHWRKVVDYRSQVGWIHENLTQRASYAIVTRLASGPELWATEGAGGKNHSKTKDAVALLRLPQRGARPVAWAELGALLRIQRCQEEWCKVSATAIAALAPADPGAQVQASAPSTNQDKNKQTSMAISGWVERAALWGVEGSSSSSVMAEETEMDDFS